MSNELVSAILDGECTALELDQFLTETENSPLLMQSFSRMSLVKDALAGIPVHSSSQVDADRFCAGIMAQLGERQPEDQTASTARASVVPVQLHVAPRMSEIAVARRRRRVRPMAGWAAAASVTLVAIVGGRGWFGNGQSTQQQVVSDVAVDASGDTVRGAANSGDDHFGLIPISTRGYSTASRDSSEICWAHLDPEAAQELALSEQSHLHLSQGMQGYAQFAGLSAHYQTASDPR